MGITYRLEEIQLSSAQQVSEQMLSSEAHDRVAHLTQETTNIKLPAFWSSSLPLLLPLPLG